MQDEDLWKSMLDVYTQALSLYGALVLAAMVLVFTVLTLFQPHSFSFSSPKGAGIVILYSLLVIFTAWVGSRVVVAFEVIGEAMRNLKSGTTTLEKLDRDQIERIDPLRFKYRFYQLSGRNSTLELIVSSAIIILMVSLFYLYYLVT